MAPSLKPARPGGSLRATVPPAASGPPEGDLLPLHVSGGAVRRLTTKPETTILNTAGHCAENGDSRKLSDTNTGEPMNREGMAPRPSPIFPSRGLLLTSFMLSRFQRRFAASSTPFELVLPEGTLHSFGRGRAAFRIVAESAAALRALGSLDEARIFHSYLSGELAVEGDMLRPFALREALSDFHPFVTAWRFVQPLVLGQVRTNKRAIASHYDRAPEFFLSFLDAEQPIYTQGIYETDDEPLAAAALRKFSYCYEKCNLRPGDHLLEVGPGWGAWFKYASRRGVKCTGLSISKASIDYLAREATTSGFDWELICADILEYETETKYDAIVMMGVIEHLPQYERLLKKFASLLRVGGRIFIDGSACSKKYELASTMVQYIFPGNHSLLVMHEFLAALEKTPLRLREVMNDGHSYFLTFQQWARNFEQNRDAVMSRFGRFEYRLFHLYLWATAYQFLIGGNTCYRMVLELPNIV
jgi:cyclopropane-fatty-acyl-phospholipid synthase